MSVVYAMRKARFKIRRRAVSADSRINLFPNSCILSVNFIIFAPRLNGSGPRGRFERGTRSGCSAARLARQLRELEVPGSNPGTPTKFKSAYLSIEPLHPEQGLFLFFVAEGYPVRADTLSRSEFLKKANICGTVVREVQSSEK